jgi:predicted metal-dependent hydrolase
MEQIRVGDIEIEVRFKDIKHLHLSVHPPLGRVTVAAPRHIELDTIRLYAATKLSWIRKERRKLLGQEREIGKEFITRESHFFLGRRYLLKITPARRSKVMRHHTIIELLTTEPESAQTKEQVLYNWYRRELRKVLDQLIRQYAQVMELPVPAFGIRRMKTKWGSCATDIRRLWFNIELAKKPLSCIEYIVVHELVHLIERRHNKNFVLLMNRYLPSWQVQKKILNELPI